MRISSSLFFPLLRLAVWSLWLCLVQACFGSGTVTNLTQEDLQSAMSGGGTVLFGDSGTLTLTSTIPVTADTILDGGGQQVTISGGNAVRLFEVGTNVACGVK